MEVREMIKKLKQSNVSKDQSKTKERVRRLWKTAGKPDREAILSLTGVAVNTIRRVYHTGNISAKLAVPISQILDVSPYYLTGQADEQGMYSDVLMIEFLRDLKYDNLVKEIVKGGFPSRQRRAKPSSKKAPEPAVVPEEPSDIGPSAAIPEQAPPAPATLTEEEAVILLKAVLLKAKAGGPQAEKAAQVIALLLS